MLVYYCTTIEMSGLFKLTLQQPLSKVIEYVSIIRKVDHKSLVTNNKYYVDMLKSNYSRTNIELNNHFMAFLYCGFIHPVTYDSYGKISSWYNTDEIKKCFATDKYIYDPKYTHLFQNYVKNQRRFFEKVKSDKFISQFDINEKSIDKYEKFMYLHKKYPNETITPDFEIDLIWHAHMLDHANYVKATKRYVGRIIDHNDSSSATSLEMYKKRTNVLWENEFGRPLMNNRKSSNVVNDNNHNYNNSCNITIDIVLDDILYGSNYVQTNNISLPKHQSSADCASISPNSLPKQPKLEEPVNESESDDSFWSDCSLCGSCD